MNQSEIRKCKNCQNCLMEFQIEPEDFAFYEKIQVPAPTFCPECRLIRRMCWRNERTLYKRKCDAPGHNEEIISIYHKDSPFKVYDQKYWWSDEWDSMEYGRDYDFSKPFFEQFFVLIKELPLPALINKQAVNSEYCNSTKANKNCYLIFASTFNENCYYSSEIHHCKDCLGLKFTTDSEQCYELSDSVKCFKVVFGRYCNSCYDSAFLYDCRNCSNCFGCVNLRHKQYYIFNKPYSKEEYFKELQKLNLNSFSVFLKIQEKFEQLLLNYPYRYAMILKSYNCSGDDIFNSKNCHLSFQIWKEVENCKYGYIIHDNSKDLYDVIYIGNGELCYETCSVSIGRRILFSKKVWGCSNVDYSYNCQDCHNIFGCVQLRHKQYCILNKQYTKEEYERLIPKIIEHMNEMPYVSKFPISNNQFPNKSQIESSAFNPLLLIKRRGWLLKQPNSPEGVALRRPYGAGKFQTNEDNFKSKEIIYRYGEFFPPELSPFCYNETIAQEYFPLTKEEAIAKGYRWKEPEERNYQITMKTEDIPDNIKDVDDSIINEIIECTAYANSKIQDTKYQIQNTEFSNCATAFKIIPQELQFYRRMNLPLPRLCPNCRHYERIKQRNPLKLWHRKCMCAGQMSDVGNQMSDIRYQNTAVHFHEKEHCPNEFETTYAPERQEIVYCEDCYKSEVV